MNVLTELWRNWPNLIRSPNWIPKILLLKSLRYLMIGRLGSFLLFGKRPGPELPKHPQFWCIQIKSKKLICFWKEWIFPQPLDLRLSKKPLMWNAILRSGRISRTWKQKYDFIYWWNVDASGEQIVIRRHRKSLDNWSKPVDFLCWIKPKEEIRRSLGNCNISVPCIFQGRQGTFPSYCKIME